MTENKSSQSATTERKDRAIGTLLGLACGDALGRPVEFRSRTEIEREYGQITEMLGHGTHGQPAGTVTDDTDMALCIARSLVDNKGFEPVDVAARFVEWYESRPFDIGLMSSATLRKIRDGEQWRDAAKSVWEQRGEGSNAGNGSVMRCAPYALAFADESQTLVDVSQLSSAITHYDPRCTTGCAVLNRILAGFITGESDPLSTALDEITPPEQLGQALKKVPDDVHPERLKSSGFVVHTLQSALYHGLTASSPKEGISKAVNMGNDTDTVGAVTGAIVGARFGVSALPDNWIDALSVEGEIRELSQQLFEEEY